MFFRNVWGKKGDGPKYDAIYNPKPIFKPVGCQHMRSPLAYTHVRNTRKSGYPTRTYESIPSSYATPQVPKPVLDRTGHYQSQ